MKEKPELWLLGQFVSHPLLAAAQPIHGQSLDTSASKSGGNLGLKHSLVQFQQS